MRAGDRRAALGKGRRLQYLFADSEPQNRARDRPEKEPGAMDRARGRNLGRAYRTRDNDWDHVRMASQRGRQTAAVVAAVHHHLLRVNGPAGWNLRILRSAGSFANPHNRDRTGIQWALRRGSLWN